MFTGSTEVHGYRNSTDYSISTRLQGPEVVQVYRNKTDEQQ
jgi:hypothetical protein